LGHIAHETAICHTPPINRFIGERKKPNKLSRDRNLSMLCFYETLRRSFFWWTQHFDSRCVSNPTD